MTEVVPGPMTLQPSISIAHAGRLLRRVEAHHAEQGWQPHSNMHIYVVCDRNDVVTADTIRGILRSQGTPVLNSRYMAQPILPVRQFARAWEQTGNDVVETMSTFAFNIAYASTDWIREAIPEHAHNADLLDEMRELLRMSGIVGFISCGELYKPQRRLAAMVDVHNRVHHAQRLWGEPATLDLDVESPSSVTDSLRMIVDATQSRVPMTPAGFRQRYRHLTFPDEAWFVS